MSSADEGKDRVLDGGAQLTLFATGNPTVDEAFSAFCQVYMPGRNFTAGTRRGYWYDLAQWLSHVAVSHVKALSTFSIQHYPSQLDAKGLKASTRERKIAAITTFLRFLEEQHVLPNDLSSALVWPKVESGEPQPLRPAQYTALFQEAATNLRDFAMFATLLQTGIRLSELTGLTLASITLPAEPSQDLITGYGLFRIKRRGGRLTELVVNYKAARTIQAYLAVRLNAPSQSLFLNKFGKPLGNRSVEKAFKKYATRADIPWAHVESLRTTHIIEHLARKTGSTIVQENAGLKQRQMHSYTQFVQEAQIRAMQEHAL